MSENTSFTEPPTSENEELFNSVHVSKKEKIEKCSKCDETMIASIKDQFVCLNENCTDGETQIKINNFSRKKYELHVYHHFPSFGEMFYKVSKLTERLTFYSFTLAFFSFSSIMSITLFILKKK